MMKYICVSVVSVVMYAIVPASVSAERLSYSGTAPRVFQHWFERNPSFYNVAEIFKDRFGVPPRDSYYGDTVGRQGGDRSTSERSDDSTSHKDLASSPNISPNVDGHTGGLDRHFDIGRGPEGGDPGVKDLRGMDGGGFAPPGSYTGSGRRP